MAFSVTVTCSKTAEEKRFRQYPSETVQTTYKFFNLNINEITPPVFSYECPHCGEKIEFKSIKSHIIDSEDRPKGLLKKILGPPTYPKSYNYNGQIYSLDELRIYSSKHKFCNTLSFEGKVFIDIHCHFKNDAGKIVAFLGFPYEYQSIVIYGQWYDWEVGIVEFHEKFSGY